MFFAQRLSSRNRETDASPDHPTEYVFEKGPAPDECRSRGVGDEGFGDSGELLVVVGEPAVFDDPGEGPLDHPVAAQRSAQEKGPTQEITNCRPRGLCDAQQDGRGSPRPAPYLAFLTRPQRETSARS